MTLTDVRKRPAAALSPRRRGWPGWIAVAVWASGIAAAFAVGWYLRRAGLATEDRLPPLHARARGWPLTWQMLPGAAVAAAAVAALPVLAARLPWRALPPVAWAGAALWTVALAVSGGWGAPAAPLDAPTEYPAGLAQLRPDPLLWLQTFTERLGGYTTHVRGHPPMPMLVLWALEKAGFAGTGWAAAFIIAAGTSAVAAIAVTVRCVAGERAARAALPFLVLAPMAVWVATSMDAFFLAVGAWGTALAALAARRAGTWALACAVAGGVLLGCLPYLSYGLLPLFAVPLAVLLLARPRVRVLVALAAGLAVAPGRVHAAGVLVAGRCPRDPGHLPGQPRVGAALLRLLRGREPGGAGPAHRPRGRARPAPRAGDAVAGRQVADVVARGSGGGAGRGGAAGRARPGRLRGHQGRGRADLAAVRGVGDGRGGPAPVPPAGVAGGAGGDRAGRPGARPVALVSGGGRRGAHISAGAETTPG
ncbi:hypothetical protein LUX57_04015 [Actinomadura madurae]|uniref:hypothetical protein n=1 Tax=Actinomadura madurae TaxID=1993 RepID=UPI0020D25C83|nr:hypothetical protein [Actinomadura madurae]MCP9964432.1 hypothetical protein [Actinomadura madurae]